MNIEKNLYYNWQLLRRQSAYREFYDRYEKALNNRDEQTLNEMTFEQANKWSITVVFDYRDNEFPPGFAVNPSSFNSLGPKSVDELSKPQPIVENLLNLSMSGERDLPRYLPIVVDLKRYKDVHGLAKFVKDAASDYQIKYGRATPNRTHSDESALVRSLRAFDEYETLISENQDHKACCREIARRLIDIYKNEHDDNPSNFSRTVSQDVDRIKQFAEMAPYVDFSFD